MMIRKGPFGHFAVEEIGSGESIYEYAIEIVDGNNNDPFLPVYVNKSFDGVELAFDFSGYIPIEEFINNKVVRTAIGSAARRNSIGGLFLSIHHLIDELINPSMVLIDPRYIFTDSSGSLVKVCCMPVKTDVPNRLCSINSRNMELLLGSQFFSEVLTEDEINALVYSINNNDEDMFVRTASAIASEPKTATDTKDISDKLVLSLLLALSSFVCMFISTWLSLAAFVAAVLLTVLYIRGLTPEFSLNTNKQDDSVDDRSRILFDDSGKYGLNCAFLESYTPVDGAIIKYAVYQDLTTIGSDRFLSDLYINSPDVSPIHAQIFLTEDTVYLSDCSSDGKTFIDDKQITPEVKHEIKNGQKITFGSVDFSLSISL